MVGKYQPTLAGGERLQVVNVRLSLPPSSGQFSVSTTIWPANIRNEMSFEDIVNESGVWYYQPPN
jgi:hypothetical protein